MFPEIGHLPIDAIEFPTILAMFGGLSRWPSGARRTDEDEGGLAGAKR
jgi:hypothetical protein